MNYETQPPTRLLKAVQVAEILSVSRSYAYQLMQKGGIPTVKFGKRSKRVRLEDLSHFIQERISK